MNSLSQELLLLALDDDKGSVGMSASVTLDTALAGAQLLDLALAGRIVIEDDKVRPLGGPVPDDPVLNQAMETIRRQDRPRRAKALIPKLAKGLRKRLLAQLTESGLVRKEERKLLGVVKVNRYPQAGGSVEEDLRARLRAAVLEGATPDARTAALAAALHARDLAFLAFNRPQRKASKQRLKEIAAGQALSTEIAKAVAAVKAAAMA